MVAADAGIMQIQLWNKEGRMKWRRCVVEQDPVACALGNWSQGDAVAARLSQTSASERIWFAARQKGAKPADLGKVFG